MRCLHALGPLTPSGLPREHVHREQPHFGTHAVFSAHVQFVSNEVFAVGQADFNRDVSNTQKREVVRKAEETQILPWVILQPPDLLMLMTLQLSLSPSPLP